MMIDPADNVEHYPIHATCRSSMIKHEQHNEKPICCDYCGLSLSPSQLYLQEQKKQDGSIKRNRLLESGLETLFDEPYSKIFPYLQHGNHFIDYDSQTAEAGTFGGEVVSLAAALATLKKLRKLDAPTIFQRVSARIRSRVALAIERTGLTEVVSLGGVSWWPRLILCPHIKASQLLITSLLRQELLANGILIGSAFKITNPQASSSCGCGTSFSI